MGYNQPDSSAHGISQERTLKWVGIYFSRESSRPRDQTCVSCIDRQILYHWVTRETQIYTSRVIKVAGTKLCTVCHSKTQSNLNVLWEETILQTMVWVCTIGVLWVIQWNRSASIYLCGVTSRIYYVRERKAETHICTLPFI